MNYSTNLEGEGFLRLPEVLRIIPVSRSTWWSLVAAKKAPSPVKLSTRTSAWSYRSIREFIETIENEGEKRI